jgi:hypothetical protein
LKNTGGKTADVTTRFGDRGEKPPTFGRLAG